MWQRRSPRAGARRTGFGAVVQKAPGKEFRCWPGVAVPRRRARGRGCDGSESGRATGVGRRARVGESEGLLGCRRGDRLERERDEPDSRRRAEGLGEGVQVLARRSSPAPTSIGELGAVVAMVPSQAARPVWGGGRASATARGSLIVAGAIASSGSATNRIGAVVQKSSGKECRCWPGVAVPRRRALASSGPRLRWSRVRPRDRRGGAEGSPAPVSKMTVLSPLVTPKTANRLRTLEWCCAGDDRTVTKETLAGDPSPPLREVQPKARCAVCLRTNLAT